MTRVTTRLPLALLVLACSLTEARAITPGRGERPADGGRERYEGLLATMTGRGSAPITIAVERMSTQDEVQAVANAFRRGGQDAAVKRVRRTPEAAWVRVGTRLAERMRIVTVQPTAKGRRLILLSDRNTRLWEHWEASRSLDYPFGIVVLDVDATGRGEGQLYPAARATFLRNGTVVIEGFNLQPARIVSIRRSDR